MSVYEQDKWRGGRVAVYRGDEYRFWTDPALGVVIGLVARPDGPVPADLPEGEAPGSGASGYLIDRTLLDAMYEWRWFFEWRGEKFRLLDRRAGEVYGEVLGNFSRSFIESSGLTMYGRYEAGGWIPEAQIANLREERTDLLVQWKAKHSG
jgi:hypothetical protein